MKSGTKLLIGCFTAVVGLACLVLIGGAIFVSQLPSVSQQVPQGAAPIIVNLTLPTTNGRVPLNSLTAIHSEAIGSQPITTLQLWVDGVPVDAKAAPTNASTQFSANFNWLPATEGQHILLVRAVDTQGTIVNSNLVRINAAADVVEVIQAIHTADDGQTIGQVADILGVASEVIAALNPTQDPNQPLVEGQEIIVPVELPPALGDAACVSNQLPPDPCVLPSASDATPPPPDGSVPPSTDGSQPPVDDSKPQDPGFSVQPDPPTGPAQPAPTLVPNPLPFWALQNFPWLFGITLTPAAPELAVNTQGCNVNLFIIDTSVDETGYFIYRVGPTSYAFERIATIDANNTGEPYQYTDPGLAGLSLYYVASFNDAGESPSNLVNATLEAACAQPDQSGLGIQDAKLTVSQPVDKLYCYSAFDNGPWTRLPPGQGDFIFPDGNGQFDLSPYLNALASPPPQNDVNLKLECWGWKGGVLIALGDAQPVLTPKPGNNPFQAPGGSFDFSGSVVNQPQLDFSPLPPNKFVVPPYDVATTNDPQQCIEHFTNGFAKLFAATLCPESIVQNQVIITWNWQPTIDCFPGIECGIDYVQAVDGFNVYTSGGELVDTIDDSGQTVAILPPLEKFKNHPTFFQPACYQVTAFNGKTESAPSDTICAGEQEVGLVNTSLNAAHVYTDHYQDLYSGPDDCFSLPGDRALVNLQPAEVAVGYEHFRNAANCDYTIEDEYSGHVAFNLTGLSANKIKDAALVFDRVGGLWVYQDQPQDCSIIPFSGGCSFVNAQISNDVSCAAQLWLAKPVVGKEALKLIELYQSLPADGNTFSVPLTAFLKQHLKNGSNTLGFVLWGGKPAAYVPDQSGQRDCYSRYGNFRLEFKQFP